MEKFGRKFELTIYPAQYLKTAPDSQQSFTDPGFEQTITITNPFTLVFNIRRKALASVNTATIQIFNLGETTRNQLYKDYTNLLCLRRVTLRAGYSYPLPVIFDGNIKWCTSSRQQGNTNFITEIEAYDWQFPVVNSHTTMSKSVNRRDTVNQLVNDMVAMGTADHHLNRGFIHEYPADEPKYNRYLSGYSWKILKDETQGTCFIDNGFLHILEEDDCFVSSLDEISSETGLLGAPKRSETYVVAEMMFEPTLAVGQLIALNTTSQRIFNGNYKIFGINHFGMISDAIGGRCQTNVSLYSFQKNANLISPTVNTTL